LQRFASGARSARANAQSNYRSTINSI